MTVPITAGTILVASPLLSDDPAFSKSTLLVLKHDETGTLAINISGKVLVPNDIAPISSGGPEDGGVLRLLYKPLVDSTISQLGTTGYIVRSLEMNDDDHLLYNFVISGRLSAEIENPAFIYAKGSWGAGQLAAEIASGFWSETTATLDALMSLPSDQRWAAASAKPVAKKAPKASPKQP